MSWRDRLLSASFRGVPFKVEGVDTGVGRRNVTHQYPFRDDPYVEDLGADADEFVVTGYVIQNLDNDLDYFDERNALIEALKKSGSGVLIHPFLGQMTVSLVGKARITESFAEGGIARFSMTFSQTGPSTLVSIYTDNISVVDVGSQKLVDAATDDFDSSYIHSGITENKMVSALTSAFGMMKKTVLSVRDSIRPTIHEVISRIDEQTQDITTVIQSGTDLIAAVTDTQQEILRLIGIPDSIIGTVVGTYSGRYRGELIRLPEDPIPGKLGTSIVYSLISLQRFGEAFGISTPSIYGGQVDPVGINSERSAQAALNQMQLVNMIRNNAIAISARVAIRTDFESYEEAAEMTTTITDAIDDQLEKMGGEATMDDYSPYGLSFNNENSFLALEDLRSIFVKSMRSAGASLAHVVDYTIPPQMFTALQLAYDRYEDITRDQEIIDRNRPLISNPGMLPTGQTIQILSQ